jgi:DNA-binding response OmpR family regulator
MARILVVEDDEDLREVMTDALAADGHEVHAVANGEHALDALAERDFEMVLLDIGLGAGPDGIEICRRLRGVDADIYVTAVTARDAEADIVLALEAGADDYVVKPIGIAELRSRVRAALRRVQRPADEERELLRTGALAVDASARTAVHDETPLALTGGEFAVLTALLRAHGRVLSRQELLQAIFGDDAYRDPRAIDFHVHHLREKLAAAGGDGAVIATVRGAGYRIVE